MDQMMACKVYPNNVQFAFETATFTGANWYRNADKILIVLKPLRNKLLKVVHQEVLQYPSYFEAKVSPK
jgi:hypothetical protein